MTTCEQRGAPGGKCTCCRGTFEPEGGVVRDLPLATGTVDVLRFVDDTLDFEPDASTMAPKVRPACSGG